MKKVIVSSMLLLFALAMQAQINLNQFADLYPNCVDNEPSKIYSPDEPFVVLPEFPGCKDMGNTTEGCKRQMMYYVYQNTEYPNVFDASGVQIKGTVLVRAVIDRCGVVKLPKVIQSLSDQQDAEAIRVIQSFPLMKPGELDGERIKVALTIPVSFKRTIKPKEQKKSYDKEDFWDNWDNWDY
ncbi:MAG: energy transducer TonB [Prevotellaceae bacterium]|jgi:hypothetical protein|nr:energy transducer TonB [Prevotellaceae bacterium]